MESLKSRGDLNLIESIMIPSIKYLVLLGL